MLERDVQIKAPPSASFINNFQAAGSIPAASRLYSMYCKEQHKSYSSF